MAKGIFPQMSTDEIVNSLAGWDIEINPIQLRNPTPDFVEGVYCACLQQVTNISHDSLRYPVQNALDSSQTEDQVRACLHCTFTACNSLQCQDLYTSALARNMMLYHL